MKSRQKVTRIHLKINTNEEYSLIGIVTTEPDYKLSLSLNDKLKISLKNYIPVEIKNEDGSRLNFSRFSDMKGAPDVIYNLISNRSDKKFLLAKFKKIDYFFQVQNPKYNNIEELTGTLREIDRITAVFSLDPKEIKDKNLLYLTP
jgi:hypothetical protein